jgi:two-component system sensor histidine kinase UhpB
MLEPDRQPQSLPRLAATTAAVLVAAYFVFWLLASFAELRSKPDGFGTHASVTYVPLAASGLPLAEPGPQVAPYKAPYRFISRLWDPRVAGARIVLPIPDQAESKVLGLMLSTRSDVIAVRLNGHAIASDIRQPRLPGAFVAEPALYELPQNLRNFKTDRIELDVRRSLRDPIIFPDFAIAPLDTLKKPFAWRNLMAVEVPLIGIVLSIFSILLYVMIAGPDVDRAKNLAFIGTMSLISMSSAMFLFFDQSRFPLEFYIYPFTLITFGLAISAISFAYIETGQRTIAKRRFIQFLVVLLLVSVVVSMSNYNGKAERVVPFITYITAQLFATGALVVASAMLAWEIAGGEARRFLERFVLIVCFGVIALDRSGPGLFTVSSPLARDLPLSLQWMPIIGSLVGCAMVFVLAKHAEQARSLIQSANATLEIKLNAREAELTEIYASRAQLQMDQAANEERQRIMRDMHDGLGSQLMSMLLAARRGAAKPAMVAEGLQAVIDDMRLLIDSMDSVGESLGSAFVLFRERVKGRVEGTGMTFHWHEDSAAELPAMSPREVLQVFRIMQEAVTNALRHSGGTALSVTIAPSPEPAHSVRIGICDNGAGLGQANPRGKGMDSMTARAAGIGARLQVQANGKGVGVFLDLPNAVSEAPT